MHVLGWLLALVGLVTAGGGVAAVRRHRQLARVPFRRPSELSQRGIAAADAMGMVATEGSLQVTSPLAAPISGDPCLAYELVVERRWEKIVVTEKGEERQKGTEVALVDRKGSVFQLADGAGSVLVDATTRFEAALERGQTRTVSVTYPPPSTVRFDRLEIPTPHDSRLAPFTTAFAATERVLRPASRFHAIGQYVHGPRGLALSAPPAAPLEKLHLASGGRSAVFLRSRLRAGGLLGLGVATVALGLWLVSTAPRAAVLPCAGAFRGAVTCEDRVYGPGGATYTWTVEAPGTFEIRVNQRRARSSIYALVRVVDASGGEVGAASSVASGDEVTLRVTVAAGTFALSVADREKLDLRDAVPFTLDVRAVADGAADAGSDGGPDAGLGDGGHHATSPYAPHVPRPQKPPHGLSPRPHR